jgi:hypothetical protein
MKSGKRKGHSRTQMTRTLTNRSASARLERVRLRLDCEGLLAKFRADVGWSEACRMGSETIRRLSFR